MRGFKTSINVATAAGIVLFEILRQHRGGRQGAESAGTAELKRLKREQEEVDKEKGDGG